MEALQKAMRRRPRRRESVEREEVEACRLALWGPNREVEDVNVDVLRGRRADERVHRARKIEGAMVDLRCWTVPALNGFSMLLEESCRLAEEEETGRFEL